MNIINQALINSLHTGFIDKSVISQNEYLPQLLVNDSSTHKKVLSTIDWELKNCTEFWFSVAFVTTSGVATLINTFIELEEKGVKGKILVSQYQNFSQPEALRRLLQFKNIELKISVEGNLHTKGYFFKNDHVNSIIVGSSNLTSNALCFNKEWNLKISATSKSFIYIHALKAFAAEFDQAVKVDEKFIQSYEPIYLRFKESNSFAIEALEDPAARYKIIKPNSMQVEALANINKLRNEGQKKALLISATGTGKTYLSAFDAFKFNPKKLLFVVHRENIAKKTMSTFKAVFGSSKTMGLYTGNEKNLKADFIFSTIQTISKKEHYSSFSKNHFEYIIIDESHHAGAKSYDPIFDYFTPGFILGMTATPERKDGNDIFKLYDHNIAYEIRLHRAMEENMLCPFHYYGIRDITVNKQIVEKKSDFNLLTAKERINHIINKVKLFGSDTGPVRGLVFCSRTKECIELAKVFNLYGIKSMALDQNSSEEQRANAILRLETDNETERIEYIFTVDIFNEGIDIPKVNQVIMLRPTQSAIVFVQQLGRGLRKAQNKDYLTVIDFIGNYNNNFLVPIALYGDTSYNKDTLRKLLSTSSALLPGTSTINFDKITKEEIYKSIDNSNLHLSKDLTKDYLVLKNRLGKIPMMCDFLDNNSRDPYQYVIVFKSYFNFILRQEATIGGKIANYSIKILELFSSEIANAKRIEEVIILQELIAHGQLSVAGFNQSINKQYGYIPTQETLLSCIRNINLEFINKQEKIVLLEDNKIEIDKNFADILQNSTFKTFLIDLLNFSKFAYDAKFNKETFVRGFIMYQKYSRKDVCRILNWERNEESTVYGYRIKHNTCPIFVNYQKEEEIASSTKFDDRFLNKREFQWFSKPQRRLTSNDVVQIRNHNNELRLPLFIKKSNGEGTDFYYMGEVVPEDNSFTETTIKNDKGKDVPVVKVKLLMEQEVEDSIYNYLTHTNL